MATLQLAQRRAKLIFHFPKAGAPISIPIFLEIFKTKYVQEADGPSHVFGVLSRWGENCGVDFLENPQEEVPIDALWRHGVEPTGYDVQEEGCPFPVHLERLQAHWISWTYSRRSSLL